MKRGRLITFEGGEGVGKSTQIERLAETLRGRGLNVDVTREPGGSPGAEAIRHVLLSGSAKGLGADFETMLFAAARADHVTQRIEPALARGEWVLCDRFIDSTRVYQGVGSRVDPDLVSALERVATGGLSPDLTIILDLPAGAGLVRARERGKREGIDQPDRFEAEALDMHRRMRRAFRDIALKEPERCVLVDARPSPDQVAEEIAAIVAERFAITEPRVLADGR